MDRRGCVLACVSLFFYLLSLNGQTLGERNKFSFYLNDSWVDSVYQQLSPDERIAQLFWLMTEKIGDDKSVQYMLKHVELYQPGGLLYMKNDAASIARFSNMASQKSKVPLIFSIDGENGVAFRIPGVIPFPKAMTLGAIHNDELIYRVGGEVANQFRRMGLHVNFAPVADVNINANNPVIGTRSFGENPSDVAAKSVAYMNGMQDGGIVAVAKHFPGHGDTNSDSHHVLPLIKHSRERLDSVEFIPFNALIKNGVMGVMSAHLEVSSLDTTKGLPASLSKPIVTDLLKYGMGFHGVVITDAMNMKGVKRAGEPGRVDVLALMAGNDIVESTENIGAAITAVKIAIDNGELSWSDIEQKCRKSLALKRWAQCDKWAPVKVDSALVDLNAAMDKGLLGALYENALTVIASSPDSVKMTPDSTAAMVLVSPGAKAMADSIGAKRLIKQFALTKGFNQEVIKQKLVGYSEVIICVDAGSQSRSTWNDALLSSFWTKVLAHPNVTVVFANSPYQLARFKSISKARELVLIYESEAYAYQAAALYLSGHLNASGKLPVTCSDLLKRGDGYEGFRYKSGQ